MQHTGEPAGFDERTDPRVFVEHDRDDERGGSPFTGSVPREDARHTGWRRGWSARWNTAP